MTRQFRTRRSVTRPSPSSSPHRRKLEVESLEQRVVLSNIALSIDQIGGGFDPTKEVQASPGDTLDFNLGLSNHGENELENPFLVFELTDSANIDKVNVESTDMSCDFFSGPFTGHSCSATPGNLAPGGGEIFEIRISLSPDAPDGSLFNAMLIADASSSDEKRQEFQIRVGDISGNDTIPGGDDDTITGGGGDDTIDDANCDGKVTLRTQGTTAILIGDQGNNCLTKEADQFVPISPTELIVIGDPPNPADITNVIINLRGGNDQLFMQPGVFEYDGMIITGLGDDTVNVDGSDIRGSVRIKTGPGNDVIGLDNTLIQDDFFLNTGGGRDDGHISGGVFNGRTTINLGNKSDLLNVDGSEFDHLRLRGGANSDEWNIVDSSWNEARFWQGAGNDDSHLSNVNGVDTMFFGGKGNDNSTIVDSTFDTFSWKGGQGSDSWIADDSEFDGFLDGRSGSGSDLVEWNRILLEDGASWRTGGGTDEFFQEDLIIGGDVNIDLGRNNDLFVGEGIFGTEGNDRFNVRGNTGVDMLDVASELALAETTGFSDFENNEDDLTFE